MKSKYRVQFPFVCALFKWGFSIAIVHPIVKIYPRTDPQAEDSILIYIGMFDYDD